MYLAGHARIDGAISGAVTNFVESGGDCTWPRLVQNARRRLSNFSSQLCQKLIDGRNARPPMLDCRSMFCSFGFGQMLYCFGPKPHALVFTLDIVLKEREEPSFTMAG